MNNQCLCFTLQVTGMRGGANMSQHKEPFQVPISPKELARLVSKQDGDGAASTQVLPHDGDFGAPRLRPPARGQTCDGGRLDKRCRETEVKRKEKDFCQESTFVLGVFKLPCFISQPQRITFICASILTTMWCKAGGFCP